MGAQVSREPQPPLPGGYVLGEQVYYTGTSATFEDGNRVEHGEQGEVVGPAIWESHGGKGLGVRFPGSERPVTCYLNHHVRRRHHRAAAHCSPPPQLTLLTEPITLRVPCGRTGKPQAATAAAGRLRAG